MGIHKLMDLIREHAPNAIKKRDPKFFAGIIVACDASMAMYQFLIAGQSHDQNFVNQMTDPEGNKTGHLLGLFNRTLALLEAGIKPVWVFDGPPPTKKNGQLLKRRKVKQQAQTKADQAKQIGDLQNALRQQQRATRITKKQKEDAIKLMRLMGVPVIQAPGEAQAQCAFLNKTGKVGGVATQDMDALTFGAKTLIRDFKNLTKKQPVTQIDYQAVIQGFKLSHEQFIDLCILCGCDYLSRIEGVGPVKAFKFIQEFRSIEKVLQHMRSQNEQKQKYGIPKDEQFQYEQARELFKSPRVNLDVDLTFQKEIDQQALKDFLIKEKNFNVGRVQGGIKRLKSRPQGVQTRLQAFFGKATVVKSGGKEKDSKKKQTKKKTK